MNTNEQKMLQILKELKENYNVLSVKAEFEAEGTRVDELLRLIEISHKAGLQLTVKIGGCEAKRDLMESKQFGVDYIVAPMVETAYALSKYILAKNSVYSEEEKKFTDFLVNLETVTAYKNRNEIVEMANYYVSRGWVFASVDYRTTEELCDSEDMPTCKDKIDEMSQEEILTFYTGIAPSEWIEQSLEVAQSIKNLQQAIAMYAAQRDAKAALRWIVANSSTYDIDIDYITVGGNSAGAITTIAWGFQIWMTLKTKFLLMMILHLRRQMSMKRMM